MTENKETKEVIMGMTGRSYYTDTRKLQFLHKRLDADLTGHPGIKVVNLGKFNETYTVSSLKSIKYLSSIVDIVESLGLSHENRCIDSITIKINPYFYISNDFKGTLILVGRYHDGSYISSKTLKECINEGYNLEFNGTLVFITLENYNNTKDDILSLKAFADKFPNGFN